MILSCVSWSKGYDPKFIESILILLDVSSSSSVSPTFWLVVTMFHDVNSVFHDNVPTRHSWRDTAKRNTGNGKSLHTWSIILFYNKLCIWRVFFPLYVSHHVRSEHPFWHLVHIIEYRFLTTLCWQHVDICRRRARNSEITDDLCNITFRA